MTRRPIAAVLAALVPLAGCAPGVLDPAGPVAAGERVILLDSLAIMLCIVVPVIVLTIAFAWWFRADNPRAHYRPDFTYSGRLELLVWSVPALVIIFLGGLTWIASHTLDPRRPLASNRRPIPVQVIALDWKWLFIYPEQGIASVNRLVVPAGTPIAFRVTSGTVMNSFFVPQLGSQVYAMAGMDAQLNLEADRPGRYEGLSAHYSGKGFSDMRFAVDAVAPARFAGWVAGAKRGGPVLDGPAYLRFARASATSHAFTYRAVMPGLYRAALKQSGTAGSKTATGGRINE